jgi:hypothetical protein
MSLFHCSYLIYKTITKWFSKLDSVIHALGMLLDFRKAEKYTACGVEYFWLRCPKVSRHPRAWYSLFWSDFETAVPLLKFITTFHVG